MTVYVLQETGKNFRSAEKFGNLKVYFQIIEILFYQRDQSLINSEKN